MYPTNQRPRNRHAS